MSKLLMSAALAALMTAPALAQAESAQQSRNTQAQDAQGQNARSNAHSNSQAGANARSGAVNAQASDDESYDWNADDDSSFDWDTEHDWINAAVYGRSGEQIGVVERVRMRESGDEVRAMVLDTNNFLGKGMRHIRLLGDDVTVISQDALPEGWTVSREDQSGQPQQSGDAESSEEGDGERRWWNWGREDSDGRRTARAGMETFTLITVNFTDDEIAMMPEFTPGPAMETASAQDSGTGQNRTGAPASTSGSANRAETGSETGEAARTAARDSDESSSSDTTAMAMREGDQSDDPSSDAAREQSMAASIGSTAMARASRGGQADGRTSMTGQTPPTGLQAGQSSTRQANASQSMGQDSWTEDNSLVGRDVYAEDETRLGSVSRVQQDGEGTQAEPIALIIITDTMGERSVSLEGRDWSNQERDGESTLDLDYRDIGEFEQDSAPYAEDGASDPSSPDDSMDNDAPDDDDAGYGRSSNAMDNQETAYGGGDTEEDGDTGSSSDSDEWTDDHAWVDTAVYSRTGSQIGVIERVRGGANGGRPNAIVLETGGFLEIGGREVELNGSNFRLTDYEGEQVVQIRYTEDELDQMPAFNEADTSDYPLSDNPMEDDESEPLDDGQR